MPLYFSVQLTILPFLCLLREAKLSDFCRYSVKRRMENENCVSASQSDQPASTCYNKYIEMCGYARSYSLANFKMHTALPLTLRRHT